MAPLPTGMSVLPGLATQKVSVWSAIMVMPQLPTLPYGLASLSASACKEVRDVSGAQQIEHVTRSGNGGWTDDSSRDYAVYGAITDTDTTWFGDTLWAKPITSIGGSNMLIYPGCRFVLYGVRA